MNQITSRPLRIFPILVFGATLLWLAIVEWLWRTRAAQWLPRLHSAHPSLLVHFGAWAFAFAPGFLALFVRTPGSE